MHGPGPYADKLSVRDLRAVVALARHLNYRRASEQLFVSQPALSRQIVAIEAALGVVLFHRASRRVALAPAGELFVPLAEDLVQALDRSATLAQNDAGTPQSVRVVHTAECSAQLAVLARLLISSGHAVTLVSQEVEESELNDLVVADPSVIALGRRFPHSRLVSRHLEDDRIVVILPPGEECGSPAVSSRSLQHMRAAALDEADAPILRERLRSLPTVARVPAVRSGLEDFTLRAGVALIDAASRADADHRRYAYLDDAGPLQVFWTVRDDSPFRTAGDDDAAR